MSETVAVKVPSKIKEKMRELQASGGVEWPAEIRAFIERRIREEKAKESLNDVVKKLATTKGVPKGFSAESVRKDRDGR